MKRTILCAAAVAAGVAFAAPAQAMTFDRGINAAQPAKVQPARWHGWRHHHPRWWGYYAYSPRHRHYTCWSERVRVWHHRWTWVRRCGWRYR